MFWRPRSELRMDAKRPHTIPSSAIIPWDLAFWTHHMFLNIRILNLAAWEASAFFRGLKSDFWLSLSVVIIQLHLSSRQPDLVRVKTTGRLIASYKGLSNQLGLYVSVQMVLSAICTLLEISVILLFFYRSSSSRYTFTWKFCIVPSFISVCVQWIVSRGYHDNLGSLWQSTGTRQITMCEEWDMIQFWNVKRSIILDKNGSYFLVMENMGCLG